MTTRFRKNLVLATAIISPLLMSAPAMASSASNFSGHQAIGLLTDSVKHTLTAYDSLDRGDTATAKRELDQALLAMRHAVETDASIGLSQKNAASLKEELKAVRLRLNSSDSFSVKSELGSVLSNAGVVVNS